VIANLAVWFALHLLFASIEERPGYPSVLDVSSVDWRAALLTTLCAILIFRFRWSVIKTLGISALAGLALSHI
jgi:chromate transporter